HYDTRLIRATGILLIEELLQILIVIFQHAVETNRFPYGEFFLDIICVWIFLAAILITFPLAKKISKYKARIIKLESFQTAITK
ncbi:unnamed protein product, partial [Adineta steineri]